MSDERRATSVRREGTITITVHFTWALGFDDEFGKYPAGKTATYLWVASNTDSLSRYLVGWWENAFDGDYGRQTSRSSSYADLQ
jgi:hypothetical protein